MWPQYILAFLHQEASLASLRTPFYGLRILSVLPVKLSVEEFSNKAMRKRQSTLVDVGIIYN